MQIEIVCPEHGVRELLVYAGMSKMGCIECVSQEAQTGVATIPLLEPYRLASTPEPERRYVVRTDMQLEVDLHLAKEEIELRDGVRQRLSEALGLDPDVLLSAVEAKIKALQDDLHSATAKSDGARLMKDGAYQERNQVVVAIALLLASLGYDVFRTLHPVADAEWESDWRNILVIEDPTLGQITWHFHDSEAKLLADFPTKDYDWDGHSTPVKYQRLVEFIADARLRIFDLKPAEQPTPIVNEGATVPGVDPETVTVRQPLDLLDAARGIASSLVEGHLTEVARVKLDETDTTTEKED